MVFFYRMLFLLLALTVALPGSTARDQRGDETLCAGSRDRSLRRILRLPLTYLESAPWLESQYSLISAARLVNLDFAAATQTIPAKAPGEHHGRHQEKVIGFNPDDFCFIYGGRCYTTPAASSARQWFGVNPAHDHK